MKTLTFIAISALFFTTSGAFSMDLDATVAITGNAIAVQPSGNTTACANEFGLWIIDSSLPSQPATLGFWGSPGLSQGVAVSGNFAYLCDGAKGVHIVDFSDPGAMTSPADLSQADYGSGAAVFGSNLFVNMGEDGLGIYDISIPDQPVHLNTYQTSGWAVSSTFENNLLAVAVAGVGVDLLDGSDLTNPVIHSTLDLPGNVTALTIANDTLYVLRSEFGLGVWDVTDPANPDELVLMETGGYSTDMLFTEDHLVIADWLQGVQIYDVSDLARIILTADFIPDGFPYDLSYDNGTLTLASGSDGVEFWDISTITAPLKLAVEQIEGSSQDVFFSVEGLIFEAAGDAGLRVWDINQLASGPVAQTNTTGWANSITASQNWIYLSDGFQGMKILTRETIPVISFEVETDDYAGKIVINGNDDLFVSQSASGFLGFNLEDTGQLIEYGLTSASDLIHGLAASTELLITAEGAAGFEVFDISDVMNPQVVAQLTPDGGAWAALLDGSTAYIGAGWNGLEVFDLSIPSAPVSLGSIGNIGWVEGLTLGPNSSVHVSSGEAGIYSLDVSTMPPFVYDSFNSYGKARSAHIYQSTLVLADNMDLSVFGI
ncbi:MAG: hypothetical protein ABIE92_03665, partial [bacterium]